MEKNKSVIIRRPRHEDAQALKKLFEDTIEFVFELNDIDLPDLKAEEISGKQAFLMEDLESNGEKRYFLIALVENRIAGIIGIGPSNELIEESTNGALNDVLEIGPVYVHPDFQKQGIGSKLMNAMYLTLLARGQESFCLDSGYKSAQVIWTKKLGQASYIDIDKWAVGNHHMVWHKSLDEMNITL
ncbi:GNAT family N-acetyltransferase [Fusibacter sp. JL216-2]|uniref:GNAT family N-acetyltransferase n=1 Tax=Fusibacter sp. JL216-2 TaxID=3071453 RepID=UPI003D3286B9